MKVTEQVDALETLAYDPLRLPRRAAGARGHADVPGGHRVRDGGRRHLRLDHRGQPARSLDSLEFVRGCKLVLPVQGHLVRPGEERELRRRRGAHGLHQGAATPGRRRRASAGPRRGPWCSAARRSWCSTRSGRWCCCEGRRAGGRAVRRSGGQAVAGSGSQPSTRCAFADRPTARPPDRLTAMINFDNVSKSFGAKDVLDGLLARRPRRRERRSSSDTPASGKSVTLKLHRRPARARRGPGGGGRAGGAAT